MEQTTTRLRKTFHYPADDGSDDSLPEALDEEGKLQDLQPSHARTDLFLEQESLIRSLDEKNAEWNLLYTRILLAVPLLSLIPYFPTLFTPHTALLSLLSITSLLSTAYLLFSLPPGETGLAPLDVFNRSTAPLSRKERLQKIQDDGPIRLYLPYMNLALCLVLVLLGAVVSRRLVVWWGFSWLPAGVYGISVAAKRIMGSVDPEGELGGLRYGFKGA